MARPTSAWGILVTLSIGVAGLIGPSAAQVLKPVERLIVRDSAGRFVGNVLDVVDEEVIIVFEVDGEFIHLEVDGQGFITRNGPFFESSNCTGRAFLSVESRDLFLSACVGPPTTTLYLAGASTPSQPVTVRSRWRGDYCEEGEAVRQLVEATSAIDLSRFTSPFSVAASSSSCGDCDGSGVVTANELTRVILNIFSVPVQSRVPSR